MPRKVIVEEQNGMWTQITEFDLDILERDGEVETTNDNGWKRKIVLVEG